MRGDGRSDEAQDVGPGRGGLSVRRAVGVPEQVLVLDRAVDRLVYVDPVVHEVGQLELLTVLALLRADTAEPDAVPAHRGPAVEVVAVQPAQRPGLDPRPTFGDQPDPSTEPPAQPRDRVERAGHLGRGQHGRLVAVEERRVAAPGVRRSVDDDPADVDAEPWLSLSRCHVLMVAS